MSGRYVYAGASDAPARVMRIGADVLTKRVKVVGHSGTITAIAGDLLEELTAGWTVDEWIGWTVRITSGDEAAQERVIDTNTADTLDLASAFATAPAIGDDFEIYRFEDEDVLLDAKPWPFYPAGSMGVCVFRTVSVRFRHDNGYHLLVTPIVDGVELDSTEFAGAAAASIDGEEEVTAWFATRGNNITARIQQLSRTGSLELVQILYGHTIIRENP